MKENHMKSPRVQNLPKRPRKHNAATCCNQKLKSTSAEQQPDRSLTTIQQGEYYEGLHIASPANPSVQEKHVHKHTVSCGLRDTFEACWTPE